MLTSITSPTPVYRLRASTRTDSLGDTIRSWDEPERVLIPGAIFDDGPSTTTYGLVARVDGTAELAIVGSFDLTADDRIEHAGEVWRIDGKPRTARSLASGTVTHARLKRSEARQ